MKKEYDCVIVGAGPAGITASIYLARTQLSCLVIGKWKLGNLYKAHIVGNYPGFSNDVSGAFLIDEMIKQAKRFGAEFLEEEIIAVDKKGDNFFISTDTKKEFKSKTLILCPGRAYKMSNIKNEKELIGKGVSYCVTCDGFFFKNKKVALLGSKNLAAGEALELLTYTKDITIFTNGRNPEFSEVLMKEIQKNGIKIKKEKVVEFKMGDGGFLEYLVFENGDREKFDGAFIALGTTSALNFATRLGLELSDTNLKVDKNCKTNLDGVWAAGDCIGSNAQAVVSAGDGCSAAISVIKYIKGKNVYLDYE
ncbi:FAD-dependent oxidoreductase [Candidatus Woesearchaeota archaeon]|nr:FAD-dependent oxidoreductase [Candidatus Woesearchaeota archaeon]